MVGVNDILLLLIQLVGQDNVQRVLLCVYQPLLQRQVQLREGNRSRIAAECAPQLDVLLHLHNADGSVLPGLHSS